MNHVASQQVGGHFNIHLCLFISQLGYPTVKWALQLTYWVSSSRSRIPMARIYLSAITNLDYQKSNVICGAHIHFPSVGCDFRWSSLLLNDKWILQPPNQPFDSQAGSSKGQTDFSSNQIGFLNATSPRQGVSGSLLNAKSLNRHVSPGTLSASSFKRLVPHCLLNARSHKSCTS